MIVRTREGQDVELRSFALTDMVRWGYNGLRSIQTQVGDTQIRGIPALHRAARLRAEAVASLRLCCWRGEGPDRQRVDTVWQSRLFDNGPQTNATNPVQTRFTFWETIEESQAWRNNAFIWKNTADGRVTDWWALHPDQVEPRFEGGKVIYRVTVSDGYVDPVGRGPGKYDVDNRTILHIRGHGQGGQLLAPTPVQVFREKLNATLGRQRHEARMWRRGISGQIGVEFPAGIGKEQADQWRESWRANYEGTEGETTLVIGGGATIKPIGMTPADAQFVEMEHLTVEDAARIMGVPANLLGAQIAHPRPDLEQDLMAWLRFGLGPELARIEDALYADPDLFGGSQTYPAFDTDDFVRGDLLTEATVLQARVQAGILTPDEARAELGYDPLPGGVGAIPQITTVGGAPNALPALSPKPGKPSAADGDADADTKSLSVPSIELRVNQNLDAIGDAVREGFHRVADANQQLASTLEEQARKAGELEAARQSRALRADEERRELTDATVAALERVGSPNVVVNVEPTPVEVVNNVTVQPADVQLSLIDDDCPPMTIDFKRASNGLIQSAQITEGA
jgi:HK97 family phage portal protein